MIISGKDLSAKMKADMAAEVAELEKKYGRAPHLAVLLVGEDAGSVSYVTGKAKACDAVGIRNTTIRRPAAATEEEILQVIETLNDDEGVDGILVQLPLPEHIDEDRVIAAIRKEKDVDGFHPLNVAALWMKQPCSLPCTPKGIIKLLKASGVELQGKRAVVVGRRNIVGLPVAKLLLDENATVTVTHSRTRNLGEVTRNAEILVVAIGRPKFITGDGLGRHGRERRGGQPRSRDGETVRRRRFRGCGAQGVAHHACPGRRWTDDDRLSDGKYDRMFPA